MRNLLSLLLFIFFAGQMYGQHDIKIQFDTYESDTLIIGYYLGEKTLVHDTLSSKQDGVFILSGEDTLDHGVYMLLSKPSNEYFQVLITEDQEFEIFATDKSFNSVAFKGCRENEIFVDYLAFITDKRNQAQPIRDYIVHADTTGKDDTVQRAQLDAIDQEVVDMQKKIMDENPDALISQLIKANIEIDIPDFEGEESEVNNKRYQFYKEHFFDNIDLEDPRNIRTPYLHNKIMTYVDQLTPINPDSIIRAIDSILKWVEPAYPTYRYYLSHFINNAASSRTIGMDAVFIHLADNYYLSGKTDWLDDEGMLKISDNASKIRGTLIGQTAPNITTYKQDGTPIAIDDIDYKYLVLLFWAPDCGHCKKTMPDVVKFEKEYRDKGVKILAICTKHKEKTKNCWGIIDEKEMTGFINTADELHRSRFKVKFNVTRTPKIYIINKEREILIKDLGAEHLPEIMDQIFELEESKSNE